MADIASLFINSNGKYYKPLNLQQDDNGQIKAGLAFEYGPNDKDVVPDTTPDGVIQLGELLDFVVNTTKTLPEITYVADVLAKLDDTDVLSKKVKDKYLPIAEEKKAQIAAIPEAIADLVLVRKTADLNKILHNFKAAVDTFDEITAKNTYNEFVTLLDLQNVKLSQTQVYSIEKMDQVYNLCMRISYGADPQLITSCGNKYWANEIVLDGTGQWGLDLNGDNMFPVQDKKIPVTSVSYRFANEALNYTAIKVTYDAMPTVLLRAADKKEYCFDTGAEKILLNNDRDVIGGVIAQEQTVILQNKSLVSDRLYYRYLAGKPFYFNINLKYPESLKAADGSIHEYMFVASLDDEGNVVEGQYK